MGKDFGWSADRRVVVSWEGKGVVGSWCHGVDMVNP